MSRIKRFYFWLDRFKQLLPWYSQPGAQSKSRVSHSLVKDRPLRLKDQYALITEDAEVERVFDAFCRSFLDEIERFNADNPNAKIVAKETGRFTDQRRYLFVKPINRPGWLFEVTGAGWIISRAEKIVGRVLFLRETYDPWDKVVIMKRQGSPLARVDSNRWADSFMALSSYEQKTFDEVLQVIKAESPVAVG